MWNKKIGVREQAGEGHVSGLWEEGRSKTDGVAKDVKSGSSGVLRHSDDWKKLGEEIQGPVMHWEMFLPTTSLKVLLVESDDSARHVVSALLRNCCYEVIAAANGLEAWKILEDLQNHVDLVLTEIMMPYLSGFDLLCKIMNHKVLKNIPVLMMSSQDSMGIVFKCLSKGAVDFLVKPIRRNELKNLWQHVWRRCHSSNGSGSESGTQTKKSAKSKSNDDSENNSGSCNDNANGSISQSIRDGCDEGSGTQGSWTKGVAERDTSQVEDATDGTYAQVNYKKPEAYSGRWVCVSEADDCREENEHFDKVATRKDLEIGISRTPDSYHEDGLGKISINFRQKMLHKSSEIDNKAFDIGLIKGGNENLSDQVADVISTTSDCANPQVESRACEVLSCLSDISPVKDKIDDDSRELPSIELGLKRPKKAAGIGMNAHDDHNVLRHSDNSAFSRYNTSCFASQAPAGNVGSCSPLGNSSVATEPEMALNSASHSSGTAMNQQSNVSDTNTDVVSGTKHVTSNPASFSDKLESTSAFKSPHVSAFHPVQKQAIPGNASNVTNMVQSQSKGSHQEVQVHHHHHYHHYHHHVHEGSLPDQDDLMLKNMAEAAPNCGSSNIFSGPVEGNIENHSLNGNASGSNHGSNGQNESCNLLNNRATNGESGNIVVSGSNGSGDVGSRTGGNGTDEDRFLQREAALTKFRNKRKERCFEKKVRYQSRKKLAEQRPRVRGQFVRQMASETKAGQGAQGDVMLYGRDCCGR